MLIRAALFAVVFVPLPAFAGADPACGPHQHVVSERDEDEGGNVKRCVCDEGWDADGPGKPCRQAKGKGNETKPDPKPAKKKGDR